MTAPRRGSRAVGRLDPAVPPADGLLTALAHELGNPLTCAALTLEVLGNDLRSALAQEHGGREAIERALARHVELTASMARTMDVARDIKTAARAGRAPLDRVRVDALMNETVLVAHQRIGPHVHVVTDAPNDEIMLPGSVMRQVLLNLILNAADALPDGGRITLTARATPSRLRVQVRDNGVGMTVANAARVFTPYFTTKPNGTGVGLSISRGLVRRCGGDMTFTTRRGRGTTFRFELPVGPRA